MQPSSRRGTAEGSFEPGDRGQAATAVVRIDEIVLSMYAGIQADDHLIEAAEPPRPLLH